LSDSPLVQLASPCTLSFFHHAPHPDHARQLPPRDRFFYNAPAPPLLYTLSLHDALPILIKLGGPNSPRLPSLDRTIDYALRDGRDRKSTRLNSSHQIISYSVFCLIKITELSAYLAQLAATSSRNELVRMLYEVYRTFSVA